MNRINFNDPTVQQTLYNLVLPRLQNGHLFVGGSLVEGRGNAKSDIDLICVVDDESLLSANDGAFMVNDGRSIHIGDLHGTRVDTEVVTTSYISELIASLSSGVRHPGTLDNSDITFMNNIVIGIAIGERERAEAWRASVAWDRWREALLERCLVFYRSASEDAQGAIAAGNWWAAHNTSLLAISSTVDALTVRGGSTNLKDKWRMDRLLEQGLDDVARDFWALNSIGDGSPADAIRLSKRRIMRAQRWAQSAGVEAPTS